MALLHNNTVITFDNLKEFLTSWGLHFDTPDGESNDIPYPQVYERMKTDAGDVGGPRMQQFISRITNTTDSRTYISYENWYQVLDLWEDFTGIVP